MSRVALALVALASIVSIVLWGSSCNQIVGIDGPDGVECSDASACGDLGECVFTSCEDGTCKHAPFPAGVSCGAGVCDAKGSCVECLDDSQCAADPLLRRCSSGALCVECLQQSDCIDSLSLPFCSVDLACVECLEPSDCDDPGRPLCSRGACVQCEIDDECASASPTTKECLEPRCVEGLCLLVARPKAARCDGDAGACDGQGDCVPSP